jgi:hypothetical protein
MEGMMPTAQDDDPSSGLGRCYRAPGWPAAARVTKTHRNGHPS